MFKIYIWILKQENSHLNLNNEASKVIPREGIKELEKVLTGGKNYFGEQAKHILNKVFPYNPNFLIPKYLDNWIPPFFSRKPPWHKLGDRVVNLKVNGMRWFEIKLILEIGYSFAPFGAVGTIVGMLGNRQENGVFKAKIEVMFDSPFIGGNNLGGRCSWGRGAVVNFDDIFNLNSWGKCIEGRDPKRNTINQDWDGTFPNSYLPSFQTDSEVSETDEESYKTNHIIAPPTKLVLQEDLIDILAKKKKAEVLKVQSKHQPKNWNRNKFQNRGTYNNQGGNNPRVANVVPKTLGLVKQAISNPPLATTQIPSGKGLFRTLIKPSTEPPVVPTLETQNLSSIIGNNLPQLPTESRFSRSGTLVLEPPINEEQNEGSLPSGGGSRERLHMEESPSSMNQNEGKINTMQIPNSDLDDDFDKHRRNQRRSVTEPIVGLGQRFRKTSDKETRKTDLDDESAKNQIKIEVSQGGHIVARRTVDLIYSENEGGN